MSEMSEEVASWSRAWYHASIADFVTCDVDSIIGSLTRRSMFDVVAAQVDAWLQGIVVLRAALNDLPGSIHLEFEIPRMGSRIDAVILTGPIVFVIEFKARAAAPDRAGVEQVWDYALDLKNFHAASHRPPIVPILVPTDALSTPFGAFRVDTDRVYHPICVAPIDLRAVMDAALTKESGPQIECDEWSKSSYQPTPTIVEAARALYAHHSVTDIARHDAGAANLRVTAAYLQTTIEEAKRDRCKVICFVTGVPGAGKTLVGLNLANQRQSEEEGSHAVYLSGNDPLVAVLREALTRDEMVRQRNKGLRVRKGLAGAGVKVFIQNVHHFRDEAIKNAGSAPPERVAVFDEAQRAWNLPKTADFMRRKKGISGFSKSEPEFLIETMDRHRDWAAIVCLVGGGQEINQGEAGIDAWLQTVNSRFRDWRMHISTKLTDSEYAAGKAIDQLRERPQTFFDDCLHLSVSMRSFRAEDVSHFVKALLDRDKATARSLYERLANRYPLVVTRDLEAAKSWLRERARGSERFGLLASSKAMRLKPHAIDIRVKTNPVYWFLNAKDDVRSSFFLEDPATEFQVQGLEVDWACVTWDADLRVSGSSWSFHDFRGSRWTNVKSPENRRHLLNAYRVLLTRARQGMVIFVPPGDRHDATRPPEYYNAVASYLEDIGVVRVS